MSTDSGAITVIRNLTSCSFDDVLNEELALMLLKPITLCYQ